MAIYYIVKSAKIIETSAAFVNSLSRVFSEQAFVNCMSKIWQIFIAELLKHIIISFLVFFRSPNVFLLILFGDLRKKTISSAQHLHRRQI